MRVTRGEPVHSETEDQNNAPQHGTNPASPVAERNQHSSRSHSSLLVVMIPMVLLLLLLPVVMRIVLPLMRGVGLPGLLHLSHWQMRLLQRVLAMLMLRLATAQVVGWRLGMLWMQVRVSPGTWSTEAGVGGVERVLLLLLPLKLLMAEVLTITKVRAGEENRTDSRRVMETTALLLRVPMQVLARIARRVLGERLKKPRLWLVPELRVGEARGMMRGTLGGPWRVRVASPKTAPDPHTRPSELGQQGLLRGGQQTPQLAPESSVGPQDPFGELGQQQGGPAKGGHRIPGSPGGIQELQCGGPMQRMHDVFGQSLNLGRRMFLE